MAGERVPGTRAAKDVYMYAFSDARRGDLSLVSTRESKRRLVNSHESLIAARDPGRRDVTSLSPTISRRRRLPQPSTTAARHVFIDSRLINYAVYT